MNTKSLIYDIDEDALTIVQNGDIIFNKVQGEKYSVYDVLKLLRELGYEVEKFI